ncbi:MAG: hypothetical protein EPO26_02465 [Chloroflexota bacterium]|nr:MAG: hypothetical protein EPO26_02465 [Chloroflexota bacterium]
MARFTALSKERIQDLTTRRGIATIDLGPQREWIQQAVAANGWGEIALEPTDNVRAVKRRTTIAGKELGKIVKWHRKSTPQLLIFQAINPDQLIRRVRRPRSR